MEWNSDDDIRGSEKSPSLYHPTGKKNGKLVLLALRNNVSVFRLHTRYADGFLREEHGQRAVFPKVGLPSRREIATLTLSVPSERGEFTYFLP